MNEQTYVQDAESIGASVSSPRVEDWKRQYGSVYLVEVDDEQGEPLSFFFRPPDRKIISAVSAIQERDQVQAAETMIFSCLLDGPREALEDVTVFAAVSLEVEKLARPRRAALKKL